jgi:hypothetical protein
MALDPVTAALDIGGKLIDRLFPDPTQKAAAQLQLLQLQQSGDLAVMTAQTDVNKVEAGNTSLFVSGWRPAVGWLCVAACGWNWIGLPIANFAIAACGYQSLNIHPADINEMLPILTGMLGIGGLRTLEKLNGKA